jgi:hypothetical protein
MGGESAKPEFLAENFKLSIEDVRLVISEIEP